MSEDNLNGCVLSKKLRRRLAMVRDFTDSHSGMYPGLSWKLAEKQLTQLKQRGLVDEYWPHNPVHDVRATITEQGRVLLEELEAND